MPVRLMQLHFVKVQIPVLLLRPPSVIPCPRQELLRRIFVRQTFPSPLISSPPIQGLSNGTLRFRVVHWCQMEQHWLMELLILPLKP